MILPKISAAILTMASHGSAYAIPDRQFCISFEQWVVMAGATNGAARVCGVERDDTNLHLMTARKNFTRFAEEHGLDLEEFDPLFERGIMEGETLTRRRASLIAQRQDGLIKGFHHDKVIPYAKVRKAMTH